MNGAAAVLGDVGAARGAWPKREIKSSLQERILHQHLLQLFPPIHCLSYRPSPGYDNLNYRSGAKY
jgi:hypothetical protein